MVSLKHNNIIVWKGFSWSQLLKFDIYNISKMFIQVVTLSRYTHTAIYLKYFQKEYLLQSTLFKGIQIIEVTGESWFKDNIENNKFDLYKIKNNVSNNYQRKIQSHLNIMYNNNEKSSNLGLYNPLGIIKVGLFNLFGKQINSSTNPKKMFCSELTNYYFTMSNNSCYITPFDITDNDFYRKVL